MNIATATEKKSLFSLERFLSRILPEKNLERIFVWVCFPVFLFFLNVGIGFLNPCGFTKFLPFLAIGFICVTFRFRMLGLAGSYVALFLFVLIFYPRLTFEEQLWQMSILFAIALNIFVLLLSIEEAESCLEEVHTETQGSKMLSQQAEREYLFVKKATEEKEQELTEEIERLKEEAELRRIEKANDLKRFEYIQSEIELLTTQKEKFVEEARRARELEAHFTQRFEEQKRGFEELQNRLQQELDATQETLLILQQHPPPPAQPVVVEESDSSSSENVVELKRALAQAIGIRAQIRSQFEEKSQVLSQTRQELFQTQGKLMALERENVLAQFDSNKGDFELLEKEMAHLSEEIERLEKEITQLEELISHILSP